MAFYLTVLANRSGAADDDVRAQAIVCRRPGHPEGDLDGRVMAFYEELRSRFPDSGPEGFNDDSPWASRPLEVGIDHVHLVLRWGDVSTAAIDTVLESAARHDLAVYDPQSDEVTRPRAR